MLEEINNLKNELIFLMEAQMQSQTSQISQENKQEKNEEKIHKCIENNLNTETTSASHKNNEQDEIKIPPLQNIFLHNRKLLVLDQEYYVWHLKKCRKYKSFFEKNIEKFGGNKAELFNAYFEDSYDNNELNNPENLSLVKETKSNSQNNQHMLIAENYVDENDNDNQKEENKQDFLEKNDNKNPIQIEDFDISKMSDISIFINDTDNLKKQQSLSQKTSQKKEEKEPNTSLDLSDDG